MTLVMSSSSMILWRTCQAARTAPFRHLMTKTTQALPVHSPMLRVRQRGCQQRIHCATGNANGARRIRRNVPRCGYPCFIQEIKSGEML